MTNQTERYLFRGMRVDAKEFVQGDLIHGVGPAYGKMYILPRTHIMPKGCSELNGWEIIPETIGQFTGLLGKNGVRIFEGDFIQNESSNEQINRYGVLWDQDECRFSIMNVLYNREFGTPSRLMQSWVTKFNFEVIGSIHDHLKTENK